MNTRERVAAGLIVLVLLIGAWYFTSSRSACTVGVTGFAATVTVQGWGAAQKCNDILADPSVLGSESFSDPSMVYRLTQPPPPTVACEYKIGNHRYTVRDTGGMIIGNILCSTLREAR